MSSAEDELRRLLKEEMDYLNERDKKIGHLEAQLVIMKEERDRVSEKDKKFSHLEAQRVTMMEKVDRDSEKDKKIRHMEAQLINAQKLSSVVFARWCLELFKNKILSKCSDEDPLKTNQKINEAWHTFFKKPPADLQIMKDRMQLSINEDEVIKDSVDELNEKRRKNNSPGSVSPVGWFIERGQHLYWSLSSIIHDLSKLNWLTSSFWDELIPMLPDFTASDKVLLNIVHKEIEPFTSNPNVVDSAVFSND